MSAVKENGRVRYTVSMPKPVSHYFEVEMRIPSTGHSELRLSMPVWTPGSYLVREFARNVLDFQASDDNTKESLKWRKESKSAWVVDSRGAETIKVRYRVYAFEFTVDTSYLDNQHGIINGASVFMFVEGMQSRPSLLEIVPFVGWEKISTSLERATSGSKNESSEIYEVPNFDILIDSPLEIGNQQVDSFLVQGIIHEVSVFTPKDFDRAMLVGNIKKIVENAIGVIGEIPYKKYLFLIDMTDGDILGGGLEHLSSTHCIASLLRLEPAQEYRRLLSLFSHEFFHVWNVKRMRPVGLGPFNYSREVYTKSLWISEGITDYYDDLILRRSRIYSVPEYLDAFVVNIDNMGSLPGSRWESAEESSFNTWIEHYRPNENTPNAHSSYYTQGAIVGWMIDMEIRRNSTGERSLDEVMRKVYYESYSLGQRGFTDEEFEKACNEICGRSLSEEIFDSRVRGRMAVDFSKYLGYAGLSLKPKSEKESSKGFLGVKLRQDNGRTIVATTLFDSPVADSGVSAGDEIISVDGLRVDTQKLSFYVSNSSEGTPVRLLIARMGSILEAEAVLGKRPYFEHRIFKKQTASSEEKALFKSWLGADWDVEQIRYEDYVPSPARRLTFDYI